VSVPRKNWRYRVCFARAAFAAGMLLFLVPIARAAMDLEQMKALAGASLLDLRVDAVFTRCGLPSAIVDTADASHVRQTLYWTDVAMKLSPLNWDIHYSRQPYTARTAAGWRNPARGNAACLSGLGALDLDAKGESGILSVTKREDNQGYTTTYTIPDDLYRAHQIVGIVATLRRGRSVAEIEKAFGTPGEIIKRGGHVNIHRYWIVHREGQMPLALYAVDFEVDDTTKTYGRYSAYSSGVGFVQEKLDALVREWEKAYVID